MYMGEGIEHEGVHYKSVEHCYQAAKARHAEMTDLENQIKNARHAGVAKALSHDIPSSQEWEDVRVQTMKEMLATKALDDPVFRDAYCKLGRKSLHTLCEIT